MSKLILAIAFNFVALTLVTLVSSKCDMMKEFRPDAEKIMAKTKKVCEEKGKLSPDDVTKIKMCHEQHVKNLMTSDAGKKTDAFVTKIFDDKCLETICNDKTCQDKIKKEAIKEIGMKGGMALKKECEEDCPKYKEKLGQLEVCLDL